jgi:D-alanyl-D-alanine carboxypeptidase
VPHAAFAVALAVTGRTYTTDDDPASPTSPAAFASLEREVHLFMNHGAVAAAVQVRWPEGEWSRAYGVRELVALTPAQPTDRVEIASVTKTMAAVTVLKLVDDSLIGLDNPVNHVIPGFHGGAQASRSDHREAVAQPHVRDARGQ